MLDYLPIFMGCGVVLAGVLQVDGYSLLLSLTRSLLQRVLDSDSF